jgi:hypothetical protein
MMKNMENYLHINNDLTIKERDMQKTIRLIVKEEN